MTMNPELIIRSPEWDAARANEYRTIFNIADGNVLELTSYSNNSRHMRDDDDYGFVEKDSEGNIIATYEAWHHMSAPRSFSASSGYRKYSPTGDLLVER